MNDHISSVSQPGAKIVSVWLAFGITSWGEAAAAAATVYSLLLISEWFYKRFWRDIFVRWGWVNPKMRRREDFEDE